MGVQDGCGQVPSQHRRPEPRLEPVPSMPGMNGPETRMLTASRAFSRGCHGLGQPIATVHNAGLKAGDILLSVRVGQQPASLPESRRPGRDQQRGACRRRQIPASQLGAATVVWLFGGMARGATAGDLLSRAPGPTAHLQASVQASDHPSSRRPSDQVKSSQPVAAQMPAGSFLPTGSERPRCPRPGSCGPPRPRRGQGG